jgi:hypothetical protein
MRSGCPLLCTVTLRASTVAIMMVSDSDLRLDDAADFKALPGPARAERWTLARGPLHEGGTIADFF